MAFKGEKQNASNQTNQSQGLHIDELDPRILAALQRESDARGGRQERRILEEALTVYLGLKALSLLQANGLAGLAEAMSSAKGYPRYSRIVE
jgi:hypothetical protein